MPTVDELKTTLSVLGVEYPKDALKADLEDLLAAVMKDDESAPEAAPAAEPIKPAPRSPAPLYDVIEDGGDGRGGVLHSFDDLGPIAKRALVDNRAEHVTLKVIAKRAKNVGAGGSHRIDGVIPK